MIYLRLFWEFFKTGLFAVGGGLATLPFLENMANRTALFSISDLADMIAISESTPGPIGINSATYFGYKIAGLPGGLVATLGLITPSIIIILIIARFLSAFSENKIVKSTFYGLRPASTALIGVAGVTVFKLAFLNSGAFTGIGSLFAAISWPAVIFAVILFVLLKVLNKHPVYYILLSAIVGILFNFGGG